MKFISVLSFVLISSTAIAQERYNLSVSQDQLNLIGKALGKMPFEEVSPTINDLGNQVLTQQRAAVDANTAAANARLEQSIQDRLKSQEPKP